MKYTKEERMEIARRVYDGEITVAGAAVNYELNTSSVKGYLRLYREVNGLPPKRKHNNSSSPVHIEKEKDPSLKEYEVMSREELIDALVMARVNEARLKKGYSVKGSGVAKEFLPVGSKNTK